MRIEKIIPMWKNIEDEYQKKNINLNRVDYFKSLVMFDGTSHNIPRLMSIVSEDLSSPECTEELKQDGTILLNLLRDVSNYLDANGIPDEIENLQIFLMECLGGAQDKFTANDLKSFYVLKPEESSVDFLPYSQMIEHFGSIDNYTHLERVVSDSKIKLPKTYIGYEVESDRFMYLTANDALDLAKANNFKNDFVLNCVIAISCLLTDGVPFNGGYFTVAENIKDKTIFGRDVILLNSWAFNTDKINLVVKKYNLCGNEVYVLC